MKKLRVIHCDSDDIENPLRGGQPVRTFQVASRLTESFDFTILTSTYSGCSDEVDRNGLKYRRLGVTIPSLGLSSHLSFLARLGPFVGTSPHDLIVEEFAPPFGFSLLPLWSRKPVISIVQWFYFSEWTSRYMLPFEKVMRALPKKAGYRKFIVQTARMGDYFKDLVPGADVWVLPCGIGAAETRVAASPGDYALYLGRLDVHHKGLDLLIDTWTRLASNHQRIPLKIAGHGPAKEYLEKRIREARLEDCIEMVGRVEGVAKTELLAGCRFLVMPSRQETFGLTALESMATSRPVLAFRIDHLEEVVMPPWGELAPLGHVGQFADMAATWWNAPERCIEAGRAGYKRAQEFLWDRIAHQQGEIYRAVAQNQAGA